MVPLSGCLIALSGRIVVWFRCLVVWLYCLVALSGPIVVWLSGSIVWFHCSVWLHCLVPLSGVWFHGLVNTAVVHAPDEKTTGRLKKLQRLAEIKRLKAVRNY